MNERIAIFSQISSSSHRISSRRGREIARVMREREKWREREREIVRARERQRDHESASKKARITTEQKL